MQEQKYQSYKQYLEDLLDKNNISYIKQDQFISNRFPKKTEFIPGPLETNLKPGLVGQSLIRYSRQMLLKQIGYEGQFKINNYKIAIVGAGGIGCPLALYLAGAGVGTLGLFDSDKVDMTNLHRQIGHNSFTLNQRKTKSLKSTLLNLNPTICVNQHPFIALNTLKLLDSYDLVIDGSDNPQCRYLVNDYLMSKNRKFLSGACVGWQGQITCYGENSPCYRCIWGDDQVSMGGCSTIGVVGMLPGFVGMILGVQALKIILNEKSSLQGHLLTYEARSCVFRKMKLRNKKSQCIACGENKMDISNYDYDKYSGCNSGGSELPQVPQICWADTITRFKDKKENVLLDVRSKGQYDILNIKDSINIPYDDLTKMNEENLQQKVGDKDKPIHVSCRLGYLSKRATDYLIKNGYTNVLNITGGINKYGQLFDPNIVNI